jgi:hypothetical protein
MKRAQSERRAARKTGSTEVTSREMSAINEG